MGPFITAEDCPSLTSSPRQCGAKGVRQPGFDAFPALLLLTGDERLGRFTLGVERIEFQVETFLCRLPRVNGAANCWRFRFLTAAHFVSPQSEEVKAADVRPGDRLGDSRQRPKTLTFVFEAVGDDVCVHEFQP